MKHFYTILLMGCILGSICQAQPDNRTIHHRTLDNGRVMENDIFSLVYHNPAMKSLQHTSTLTTIKMMGEYQKEDLASIIQKGDGKKMGSIAVQSFITQKNSSLWGEASYQNGKKLGRCWNETSDFRLLYPYVMGDTLGGNLKSEQYFFSGGYAYRTAQYIFSAEGSYRATIEYRDADPRPKNLTGDLNVRIGAAKYLGKNYLLGVAATARKYKQTNDLAFYNELGVPMIYHFTGLGTDYYRFRGAKGESFYKGHAFGGSLNILPVAAGFTTSLEYQNFQFDKVISSLNELPMASVKEDNLQAELGWKSAPSQTWQKGISSHFCYTRRIGTENIFGTASGNVFPQIDAQDKYMNKVSAAGLTGVLEHTFSPGMRLSLVGKADYTQIHTSYIFPEKEMEIKFTTLGMDARVAYPYQKWLFSGSFGVTGRISHNSSLTLGNDSQKDTELLNRPMKSNYEALKSNLYQLHTQIRADYSWNDKYSIFLAIDHQYGHDQRESKSQYVNGTLGFAF